MLDDRAARELHDDVVQALTVARFALELGDTARAQAAVDRALVAARAMLSADARGAQPGDLVRDRPALVAQPHRG